MSDDLRALDIEIAKALGYSVYRHNDDDEQTWYMHKGEIFGDHTDLEVLFYTTDANAALSLPILEGMTIELEVFATGHARARVPIHDSLRAHEASPAWWQGKTPSLAICRAWLAWKRAFPAADDVHS